ncbi:MAG: hypothetical protein RL510_129 [Actinomycetota bacterium]
MKQTMQSARLFLSETFDWLHLSRRPNQVSPNFGQQIETLRCYNGEVKSIWANFALNFKLVAKQPCEGLFATAKHSETAFEPGGRNSGFVGDFLVV